MFRIFIAFTILTTGVQANDYAAVAVEDRIGTECGITIPAYEARFDDKSLSVFQLINALQVRKQRVLLGLLVRQRNSSKSVCTRSKWRRLLGKRPIKATALEHSDAAGIRPNSNDCILVSLKGRSSAMFSSGPDNSYCAVPEGETVDCNHLNRFDLRTLVCNTPFASLYDCSEFFTTNTHTQVAATILLIVVILILLSVQLLLGKSWELFRPTMLWTVVYVTSLSCPSSRTPERQKTTTQVF